MLECVSKNLQNNKNRKPLILNGARQVGKTWLLKHFGEKEYESVAYINCGQIPSDKSEGLLVSII